MRLHGVDRNDFTFALLELQKLHDGGHGARTPVGDISLSQALYIMFKDKRSN